MRAVETNFQQERANPVSQRIPSLKITRQIESMTCPQNLTDDLHNLLARMFKMPSLRRVAGDTMSASVHACAPALRSVSTANAMQHLPCACTRKLMPVLCNTFSLRVTGSSDLEHTPAIISAAQPSAPRHMQHAPRPIQVGCL